MKNKANDATFVSYLGNILGINIIFAVSILSANVCTTAGCKYIFIGVFSESANQLIFFY
jgi:hypothetical protein